ncbi:MAG: helix-turn-helix transcriptional regulator [Chloroflexaceae bacterium]|nr:helix-turn-helix transcriptional regulator [Chloroflexaceae bacterium]
MNEVSTGVLKEAQTNNLPLSVLLFSCAMSQKMPLSDFAKTVGIGPLSLRQFISGQTQRPRGKTLELLAETLNLPVDEVRRRSAMRPTSAPPFSEWLKHHMDGTFSRARLTRETRISDGALRNYLSGQTLPDSDQAQRLAETLSADPLEIAKILVADQTVRSGGETVLPSSNATNAAGMPGGYMNDMGLNEDDSSDILRRHGGLIGRTAALGMVGDEERLLELWRQLHPQGRRATLIYIAGLLAEG